MKLNQRTLACGCVALPPKLIGLTLETATSLGLVSSYTSGLEDHAKYYKSVEFVQGANQYDSFLTAVLSVGHLLAIYRAAARFRKCEAAALCKEANLARLSLAL